MKLASKESGMSYESNKKKLMSIDEIIPMLNKDIAMVASLREGFDLIVDEVENHFHKTLAENMIPA